MAAETGKGAGGSEDRVRLGDTLSAKEDRGVKKENGANGGVGARAGETGLAFEALEEDASGLAFVLEGEEAEGKAEPRDELESEEVDEFESEPEGESEVEDVASDSFLCNGALLEGYTIPTAQPAGKNPRTRVI